MMEQDALLTTTNPHNGGGKEGGDSSDSEDDDDDLADIPDTREYMPLDVDGLNSLGIGGGNTSGGINAQDLHNMTVSIDKKRFIFGHIYMDKQTFTVHFNVQETLHTHFMICFFSNLQQR